MKKRAKGENTIQSASEEICAKLFALRDDNYRSFQAKLMPTVDPETVIGVRMPALRRLEKELRNTEQAEQFLEILPHGYYEENNLHGLLIASKRDYSETVESLEKFLPYVDNWATCDLIHPRAFEKRPENLPKQLYIWLQSEKVYTVRFALGMLMSLYLDEAFLPEYAQWAAEVRSEEYYINMMVAWYFTTALAKQWEEIVPYLENKKLSQWTHNRTIQKAVESLRITPEQKSYLRSLRRKSPTA